MLIEFTVGNYKSFRDKTTFSMVAAPLKSENPRLDRDNIIPVSKNLSLLRTAAVYGANASGKSNLGAALRLLRDFVLSSSGEARDDTGIPVEPFLFNTETREQPSFFEIVFRAEGRQYRYGFEADRQRVIAEWLFHVPTVKEAPLFLRDGQRIEIKTAFKEGRGLEGRTRPGALFLSVAAQFNGDNAQRVRKWFSNFTVTTGLEDEFRGLTLQCLRSDRLRKDVTDLLAGMDLGFEEVRVPGLPSANTFPRDWPDDTRQHILADLALRLSTVHPVFDPSGTVNSYQLVDLDDHESEGTRKLVSLAALLVSHLMQGDPLFVDELDARLHPLMTRRIIEIFHSEKNQSGQLIFATHDTNLLDRALLRRDQVWFAEKDRQGATHLYSLSDYSPRNDAALEKNYLAGRYGAIPFLGDLTRLPGAAPPPDAVTEEENSVTAEAVHA